MRWAGGQRSANRALEQVRLKTKRFLRNDVFFVTGKASESVRHGGERFRGSNQSHMGWQRVRIQNEAAYRDSPARMSRLPFDLQAPAPMTQLKAPWTMRKRAQDHCCVSPGFRNLAGSRASRASRAAFSPVCPAFRFALRPPATRFRRPPGIS